MKAGVLGGAIPAAACRAPSALGPCLRDCFGWPNDFADLSSSHSLPRPQPTGSPVVDPDFGSPLQNNLTGIDPQDPEQEGDDCKSALGLALLESS